MSEETCARCGRLHYQPLGSSRSWCGATTKVVHGYYGCDTGCCGHQIFLLDEQGHVVDEEFSFDHPWTTDRAACEAFWSALSQQAFPGIPLDLTQCEVAGLAHD